MHEIAEFLRLHPPFDALRDDDLEHLAAACEIEFAAAGSVLHEQAAAPSRFVWVVRRGAVALHDNGTLVDLLGEGEMFGHTSMLTGDPTSFSVTAQEDTLLYRIAEDAIRPFLTAPEALGFVVRSLAGRVEVRRRPPEELEAAMLDPSRRPVGELVRRPAVIVSPDASLRDAARLMVAAGSSSLLVDLGERLGIVTDSDFRSRVVAAAVPPNTPVSAIMTVPAHTVSAETTGTDVLLEMLERGLRHLPVLDTRRNVIGIVADTDLVAIERRTPFLLRREIREAGDRETLASVSRRIGETVIGLHDARVAPVAISRVISAVHDATTRRLLELAEGELGPPPERFTWFALGSFARREATPSSDSDSALAWAGDGDDPAIREELLRRAAWVVEGLGMAGIPGCSQGAVASRPLFARSAAAWAEAMRSWLESPGQEKALILISVLVEGRPVWDADAAAATLAGVLQTAPRHRSLIRGLARMAVARKPPTGFFRDFVVSHDGGRSGTLDIKRGGLLPVVDIARWAGMTAGVGSASTPERLRAGRDAGALHEDVAATLEVAFDLFTGLRMSHQVDALRAGQPPDDNIDPRQLDALTRRYLKDAFRAVASAQRGLASDIDLGAL
jgi:CBS domain-containing protein